MGPLCGVLSGTTTAPCGPMWGVASSTAQITQSLSDTGTLIAIVILAIAGGAVALMGLGFLFRHLKKWITGKKF